MKLDMRLAVLKVLFSSPVNELDVTILALSIDGPVATLPIALSLPVAESRVYMIGYPGGDLSLSLLDNLLIETNDRFLRYRAATEPGSGGSPVFNDQWQLVALHHVAGPLAALSGDATYDAAEGVSILAIIRALEDALGANRPMTSSIGLPYLRPKM
jgi:V8-like Glu-specific endopeptidase